jgi:starch synthase
MIAVSNGTQWLNSSARWTAGSQAMASLGLKASRPPNLRVLFATPEAFPLAKTGGLADVSAALPAMLAALGIDIRLVLPGYTEALDSARDKGNSILLGDPLGLGETRLIPARMPDTDLPLWLVDCASLYQRHGGLYREPDGRDWPDNALRFAALCHAVTRMALGGANIGWAPDVVHLNDWQLGLVAALLAAQSGPSPASILTIHNLAFQGVFHADIFPRLGLPSDWFTVDAVEYYGQVSFLKAGIRFADRLTTVSPRYAREILTPEFGCGLDGLLRTRADDLVGILNGIDYDNWTPENPTDVPHPYSTSDLSGKHRCKTTLQNELGLEPCPDVPLIAYVSRITEQKMADLLPELGPVIATEGAQLAICGEGDRSIEQSLRDLEAHFPGRIAVRIGYKEALARRVLAGADMLAAPARFEPCGLTQMYAMRFGTIPIVRDVGGLADTVIGYGEHARQQTTGFSFATPTAPAFVQAVRRACALYRDRLAWRAMQGRAMRRDFRWRRSAERYLAEYVSLARRDGDGLVPDGHVASATLQATGT